MNSILKSRAFQNELFLRFDKKRMMKSEQYEGILIRYRMDGKTLILVLEDFQDGFPPDLSEEVREIAVEGVNRKDIDHEGLKKSQGDNFWLTIKNDSVEIGADFMPEQELNASNVVVAKRAHDISDLRALYALMRSALVTYQKSYGLECRKTADLETGIARFIAARRDRLAAKLEFFSEKDPVKAAGFKGMLTLLDELGKELKR